MITFLSMIRPSTLLIVTKVEEGTEIEVKPKERPLASRRNYINTVASKLVAEDDLTTENKSPENIIETPPAVTAEQELQESPKAVTFTPNVVKEIEKEIAENTAKFDAQTLKKSSDKKAVKLVSKNKTTPTNNIQPGTILRAIRVLAILILGSHIGIIVV